MAFRMRRVSSGFGLRDAGLDALVGESPAEPGAVIATVSDQVGGGRQLIQHHAGALVVGYLTGAELEDDGPAQLIAYGVELGVQSAPGASDMVGNIPFLSRLAAVR